MPETTPFSRFRTQPFYTLEPHAQWVTTENGYIPIETIVERVYGKPYSSLRGCQRDNENLPNDSVALLRFGEGEESIDDYEQALFDLDGGQWVDDKVVYQPEVYLGYDRSTHTPHTKIGMTEIEYWLSFGLAENPSEADFQYGPDEDCTDLEGKTFADRHSMDLAFTPSLRLVVADLIRRGQLPRGNFIFRHWW